MNFKLLFNRVLMQTRHRLLSLRYRQMCRGYQIVGGYRRIYLFHVRKTGGTSLNHMFLAQGGEPADPVYARLARQGRILSGGKVFVGWDKKLIEQGYYYYAFSHLPIHQLSLPDRTFTMTCLRDPAKRVISHYRMLKEYAEKNIAHPCMATEGRWLGDSFRTFIDNMPEEHLLNQLYMFSESFDVGVAVANIQSCSCYFFTENFALGIKELSRSLGMELQPIHTRKSTYPTEISEDDMKYLTQKLEPEYELIRLLKESMKRGVNE